MHMYHLILMVLVFLIASSTTSMQSPQQVVPAVNDGMIEKDDGVTDTMDLKGSATRPTLDSNSPRNLTTVALVSANLTEVRQEGPLVRSNLNLERIARPIGGRFGGTSSRFTGRALNMTSNSSFSRGGGRRSLSNGTGNNGRRMDGVRRFPFNVTQQQD